MIKTGHYFSFNIIFDIKNPALDNSTLDNFKLYTVNIGKYRLVRLGVFKIIIFFKNYIYVYMNKNRAFFNTIFDIRHLGYFRH